MFHPSESIIITSKDKSDDSSERQRSILSRQRASTWSSPDDANSSPPGLAPFGLNVEKRKFRKRFSRKGVNKHSNSPIASPKLLLPSKPDSHFNSIPTSPRPQQQHPRRQSSLSSYRTSSIDESPEEITESNPLSPIKSSDSSLGSISKPDENVKKNQAASDFKISDNSYKSDSIDGHDTDNASSSLRKLTINSNVYESPTFASHPSPSSSNAFKDNNTKAIYPPKSTNISSRRIGIQTHSDGAGDYEEEEKSSFSYDDEQLSPNTLNLSRSLSEDSYVDTDHVVSNDKDSNTTSMDNKDHSTYDKLGDYNVNQYSMNSMSRSLSVTNDDYDSISDQDSDPENMENNSDKSTKKTFLYLPKPSWSRISSAVVRHAPCFWCCATVEISSTDRNILIKLNKLCAIFAFVQFFWGAVYCIVLLSDFVADRGFNSESSGEVNFYREALVPNLWMPSGNILWVGTIGFVVFVTMILTTRSIRQVNLRGALRYMWFLYWILPLQIICVLSFVDIHRVTDVWIEHWWNTRSMAGFRRFFCDSEEQCECAAPLKGNQGIVDAEWCFDNCNSTSCQDIRGDAIKAMSAFSYAFFITSAIVGLVLVGLLSLALFLLQRIISEPIVKSSKESNIPLWLTFPTILSFLGGFLFIVSPNTISGNGRITTAYEITGEATSQVRDLYTIGIIYIISGFLFLISSLLGWYIAAKTVLDNRDKTRKKVAVYLFIGMMVLTIFAVASILIYSLIYSSSIVDIGFTDDERGIIACFFHDFSGSCSNCNITRTNETITGDQICPEWDRNDVLSILQTILIKSAAFASIFVIYAFTTLRYGFNLKELVSRYEVDYV